MKSKNSALVIIATAAMVIITACQTVKDPTTGKVTKSLTPAAQAELNAFGNVSAQIIAQGIAIGATNVVGQYVSTGKVDTKQLAQAEIYGVSSNLQGYIGQLVPRSTIVAAAGTPAIQTALNNSLPATVPVTQQTVDALQAAAAANTAPAVTPKS